MKTAFHKPILMILILSGITVLNACGDKNSRKQASVPAIPAQVKEARMQEYPREHTFSGRLEAGCQTKLSTRVMGQIERIPVKTGQRVSRGQLLLSIRNQDILARKARAEAMLSEARTAFENAEKDLKRYENLYQSKSATEKEMDDVRTGYRMAKARLEAAGQMQLEVEENLLYTELRAPYNGVITGKFAEAGDMAGPGMPLLAIENPGQWEVRARIPAKDIARIRLNDPVRLRVDALGELVLHGQITEINPSSANTGPQFEARIVLQDLPGETARLYSGLYVTVDYEQGSRLLMLIPRQALVHRGQLTGLYTLGQNGTALLRWIRTGKIYEDSVEVLSGIADGEQYLIPGEQKLYDGAHIQKN